MTIFGKPCKKYDICRKQRKIQSSTCGVGGRVSAPSGPPPVVPGSRAETPNIAQFFLGEGFVTQPGSIECLDKIPPTLGSHPHRTCTGRWRIVMMFELLLRHVRPLTLLYEAVSFNRPHARQRFVITKNTAVFSTRRHFLINSACTLISMLAGDSTPSLVSSATMAPRTAATTRQEDPQPALARAAAVTGQDDSKARVSHTTPPPATICKTRVPDNNSRDMMAATVKTPKAHS